MTNFPVSVPLSSDEALCSRAWPDRRDPNLLCRAYVGAERRKYQAQPERISALGELDETYRDKYDTFERAGDLREAAAERDERNLRSSHA